jgi:ubiquinol-cytochrome c reductase cytochrome b subunit
VLVVDVILLGKVGGAEASPGYITLGQVCAGYYFAHFLIILPLIARMERPRALPHSITEAVLHGHGGTSPAQTALATA